MGDPLGNTIPEASMFPWLQDLFAINQHYRTLATMIFARLDIQRDIAVDQQVEVASVTRLTLQDISKLMAIAKPANVEEGFECSICLSSFSPSAAPKWVQLPCAHVFHRSCYRELVHHSCFNWMLNCRCPLCRLDLREALNHAQARNSRGLSQN